MFWWGPSAPQRSVPLRSRSGQVAVAEEAAGEQEAAEATSSVPFLPAACEATLRATTPEQEALDVVHQLAVLEDALLPHHAKNGFNAAKGSASASWKGTGPSHDELTPARRA